jgi:hypothetical protein
MFSQLLGNIVVRVAESAESSETNARLRDLAKVGVCADPCLHDARLPLSTAGSALRVGL